MMMNEAVQHRCAQSAMPEFEKLIKLTEDGNRGQARAQEIARIHESHWRQDKWNRDRTNRIVHGALSRRWPQRWDLDETYRMPSLFTWRC